MNTTREKLINRHSDSFPVLPVTVTNLMALTNNPDSSAQDVMEVILTDQSLCLTVLKIANSVLFGRPKKVDSIKMAIAILGFAEVERIALAKALVNSFSKLPRQHKTFIDKYWEHSFLCGMIARVIAQDIHISPDIAFMGGLIHDIGKLIMLETFADDYAVEWITKFSSEEIQHNELQMFSFTHDIVGAQLLRKWDFPENLITAVEYHHRPGEAASEKKFAAIIQFTDLLSLYFCDSKSFGDEDIVTVIHRSLPDIQSQWQSFGLILDDAAIDGWLNWLLNNYEQSSNLKEAFSA